MTMGCPQAYQALLQRHSALECQHRQLLEAASDAGAGADATALLDARQQLAELLPRYEAACAAAAELR